MYTGGTPLFDETTGIRTERYDYLVAKFPSKPWKMKLLNTNEKLIEIDSWFDEQGLNMFGDPKGAFRHFDQ